MWKRQNEEFVGNDNTPFVMEAGFDFTLGHSCENSERNIKGSMSPVAIAQRTISPAKLRFERRH